MQRRRSCAIALVLGGVLAAAPGALASGGGGGGSGSGGGGGSGGGTPCVPLAITTSVGFTDGSLGNWMIGDQATIRNCTSANQRYHINTSVPGTAEFPFNVDTALPPGGSVTWNASPHGSTGLQLQFGQTYTVVTTLTQTPFTQTATSPSSVIYTASSNVTIPATLGG